ncbi:MAG: ATPase, T2SS/T4P/T4SS family, partial [Gammaproteobacteria bacterium]
MLSSLRQKGGVVEPKEKESLEHHAATFGHKIISSQSDLDPKDHAMPQMLDWCRRQGNIVVLMSGTILSSTPETRVVQNCKVVMTGKGLHSRQVLSATPSIVQILLANGVDERSQGHAILETVSEQQKRLRLLVKEAVEAGASDIHIEVRPDVSRIRFRKHGELYIHAEWLPKLGREVASVAFNKETDHAITHFNPLVPQNASMPLYIDGKDVRLRLASMPAHGGFDVVMRLLATGDDKIPSLEELGYFDDQVALIKKAILMPHGAVIMSGPTGSGKTTTLASCMQLVEGHRKIYTIEDPVEKIVKTATQVPVNTDHEDRDFASMGRASLRMDPDVIVLGEMRDEETARVMVRASITGHLVFSTLHTNT